MSPGYLPRLVFALAISAWFILDLIAKARLARARGALDSCGLAKVILAIVVIAMGCWTAVCFVVQAPESMLWPGVVLMALASTGYLGVAIFAGRKSARQAAEPIDRSQAALEARLFGFVLGAVGVSGGLVGLRMGLWWLTLPMVALLLAVLAVLTVKEVRRGWRGDA